MSKLGVALFSTTSLVKRPIDQKCTDWLRANPQRKVLHKIITQSSDLTHHCFTITFIWEEKT